MLIELIKLSQNNKVIADISIPLNIIRTDESTIDGTLSMLENHFGL